MSNLIENILLIEDSDTDAFIVNRALREFPCAQSYNIIRCEDLEKTRDFLLENANKISLILMDINLPDSKDCFEVYGQIRCYRKDVPVIALTSIDNHELALELLKIGVEDFICKDRVLECPEFLYRAIDYSMCRS